MAEEKVLDPDTEEETETTETAMVGGPGEFNDSIVHPPEKEEEVKAEVPLKEGEVEAEGATKKEGEVEPSPPQHKFKNWEEAEKAHAESERKMHEATEEASRYKKMLSTAKPADMEAKPTEPAAVKKVWQREKEEFDTKRKALPLPDLKDPKAVAAYNEQVSDLYFEVHSRYVEIAADERVAAKKKSDDTWGWIMTEAKKYGIDDTPIDLKNEDGTVEKGTLSNVFMAVCQNPYAFGINIRSEDGKLLSLGDQVKVVSRGINRFIDGIIAHRQVLAKKAADEKKDLTVLRRGSTGPSKKEGEEEEEAITTFADGIKENLKNRRKAGSYHRRGD